MQALGLIAAGCYTESNDPFFCRRAAYSIIDIILNLDSQADIHALVPIAAQLQPIPVDDSHLQTISELFIRKQIQNLTDTEGLDIDVARAAVYARGGTPLLAVKTAKELAPIYAREETLPLVKSFSRCMKIAKDYKGTQEEVDMQLLSMDGEVALWKVYKEAVEKLEEGGKKVDVEGVMGVL